MQRRSRLVALSIALALTWVLDVLIAHPLSSAQEPDARPDGLTGLLHYVPAPSSADDLASFALHFADLGLIERVNGYDLKSEADAPEPVYEDATNLTPERLRARMWQWDRHSLMLPEAAGGGEGVLRPGPYGFDVLGIDRAIAVGESPRQWGLLELASETGPIGVQLGALGYTSEPAPHRFGGTLHRRFEDFEEPQESFDARRLPAAMNRVVLGPRLLISAAATDLALVPLTVLAGDVPGAHTRSEVALIAASLEHRDVVPNTELVGASILGSSHIPSRSEPARSVRERRAARGETSEAGAPLPPYSIYGIGYRRGPTPTERYWLITLFYPDEATARAAGDSLRRRLDAYRSVSDDEPLIGTDFVEQLEPVTRTGEGGATVTARLRSTSDRRADLYARLFALDANFIVPGP